MNEKIDLNTKGMSAASILELAKLLTFPKDEPVEYEQCPDCGVWGCSCYKQDNR